MKRYFFGIKIFGENKSSQWRFAEGFFSILLIFIFILSPISPLLAASTVPYILGYQGRLTDSSGNLLGGSGTTYYLKFSIWDNSTVGSGTKLWPTGTPGTTTATVRQGVFTVNIGDTANGFADALNYDFSGNTNIYLQVEVSSNNISSETLSPRQRISSSAFAQVAGSVVGTTTPSVFGTTTAISNSFVTIGSTSTLTVPLSLRGFTAQSAKLFDIQDASSNSLFHVNSSGGIFGSSTLQVTGNSIFYGTLRLPSLLSCDDTEVLETDASGNIVCGTDAGAAGGSPGGSTGAIQFNSAGTFGGNNGFFYEISTGRVGISTTTPYGAFSVSTSTRPQILLSDPSAGVNLKHWYASSTQGSFTIGTINDGLSTLTERFQINSSGLLTVSGGFLTNASTTLQNFTGINSTTTNSTSTNFFSTTASSTNLFATSLTTGNITSSGLGTFTNILALASTTLQNFTALNSTSTNATTTNLFSTTASSTNLFATVFNAGNITSTGLLTAANILTSGSTT
ncbi:MAG: hypothetical protein AAB545_01120, partial [Patescibacteria group bacterium]